MASADDSRRRGSDESISVAELLKRMSSEASASGSGDAAEAPHRHRRRAGESGGLSVAELTGGLPTLDSDGQPMGRAARRRAREAEEERRAAREAAERGESPTEAQDTTRSAGTAAAAGASRTGTVEDEQRRRRIEQRRQFLQEREGRTAATADDSRRDELRRAETRRSQTWRGGSATDAGAAPVARPSRPAQPQSPVEKPVRPAPAGQPGKESKSATAGGSAQQPSRPPVSRRTPTTRRSWPESDKTPMPPAKKAGAGATGVAAGLGAGAISTTVIGRRGNRDDIPSADLFGLPSGAGSHTGPIPVFKDTNDSPAWAQRGGSRGAKTAAAAGAAGAGAGAVAVAAKRRDDGRAATDEAATTQFQPASDRGYRAEDLPAEQYDYDGEADQDYVDYEHDDAELEDIHIDDDYPEDDWDREPERGGIGQWIVLAVQVLGAAVAGAALFIAFQLLWRDLKWVAFALAIVVIVGMVAIVRVLRRGNDWVSIVLAVLVGAGVTFGPLLLMAMT